MACNIAQSEAHNRRDTEYIKSLNPKKLYIRTDLSHKNESYVSPEMKGVSLQQHYDAIKCMVKQKTGRAMQEKDVTLKNGKVRKGSTPIRESVVNIKESTTMEDLLPMFMPLKRGGAYMLSKFTSTKTRVITKIQRILQHGNQTITLTSSGTGWITPLASHGNSMPMT